jgi:hypothetical protein
VLDVSLDPGFVGWRFGMIGLSFGHPTTLSYNIMSNCQVDCC